MERDVVLNRSSNGENPAPSAMPGEVELQLQRMLTSTVFQRAARPARFLEFVVRRAAESPGGPLGEAEIAEAVYGRSDFDPRLDPIVRVEAARLRKRIQEYYKGMGKDDPIQIRLPQRGYRPEIAAKESQATAVETPPEAPPSGMTVAVLPFVNLGDDAHVDGFCLGLTEEVIGAITDFADISVVARTSASQYEGEAVDVRVVGKELGVTHVLEGTVRETEEFMRVTAKLINAETGFTSWSKAFEIARSDDAVSLQVSLGGMIAETIADKCRQEAK